MINIRTERHGRKMLKLGEMQTLKVVRKTDNGVYLSDGGEERVLLPKNQCDKGGNNGTEYEVFLYKDSEDRLIATTTVPKLLFGETKKLTVKDVNNVGAFLDWGLAKDLFLPFKEQTYRVSVGDEAIVSLYIDKSTRLCATMKIYPLLKTASPYVKGDKVKGLYYEQIDNFGAFIAVDDTFSAMIPKHRLFKKMELGTYVEAVVSKVLDDGKLELAVSDDKVYAMEPDAEKIFAKLQAAGGWLPYHDKSDPELIKDVFEMSKNAFKRAIGTLYKAGKIVIHDDGISIVK